MNIEQGMSNDEVKTFFGSIFDIRYSAVQLRTKFMGDHPDHTHAREPYPNFVENFVPNFVDTTLAPFPTKFPTQKARAA